MFDISTSEKGIYARSERERGEARERHTETERLRGKGTERQI